MQYFLYLLFRVKCRLLSFLPLRALYGLSSVLFFIVYHVVGYRRKVVAENISKSFPDKTLRERKSIERRFYRFFCDLIVEIIKTLDYSKKDMERHIRYTHPEMIADLYHKGKQIFCVIGHYGNWEWLASLAHPEPYQLATLYHPLENKYFDSFFNKLRTRFGTEAIPSQQSVRAISRYHSDKRLTALCFLADQAPWVNPSSRWMTFLNQETSFYLGPEKLARRFNATVLYYEIRRVKRGQYEVDTTLICENAAETADFEITQRYGELLEATIKRNPEYWLWTHRRWKRKRPTNPPENV